MNKKIPSKLSYKAYPGGYILSSRNMHWTPHNQHQYITSGHSPYPSQSLLLRIPDSLHSVFFRLFRFRTVICKHIGLDIHLISVLRCLLQLPFCLFFCLFFQFLFRFQLISSLFLSIGTDSQHHLIQSAD